MDESDTVTRTISYAIIAYPESHPGRDAATAVDAFPSLWAVRSALRGLHSTCRSLARAEARLCHHGRALVSI